MKRLLFAACLCVISCSAMQVEVPQQVSPAKWARLTAPISKIISMCKKHPVVATVGTGLVALVVAYTTCEQFRRYVDVMVGLRPAETEFKQIEFVFDPEEFIRILQEREKAGNPVFMVPLEDVQAEVAHEEDAEEVETIPA